MRSTHGQGVAAVLALWVLVALTSMTAPAAATAEKAHNYRDRNFDYFVAGDPSLPRARHTQFALALMGGGGRVDAAFRLIASHAGGGHIVILRAVDDDSFDPDDGDYGISFTTLWGPVASAQTIVFHNREASSDPRVLAALHGADGIFIAGGDQSNYIRYWKGTAVQAALNEHVRAGRPIGGSSAGLAILGHYSYTAMDGGSMESKVALADPFSPGVTLESDFMHFRGLEAVITDSHFSARSRLGRLIVFLARLNSGLPGSPIFGVGIDENSALLVDGAGVARLAEGSAGSAWLVLQAAPAQVLAPGQPLSIAGVQITRLGPASLLDLATRKVTQPAATTVATVHQGVPAPDALTQKMMLRDKVPPDET